MSTRRVSSTLMMLFVLGSSMNAFAQNNDVLDENFVLDEMVVSATRSEKKLLDTAASVSVIVSVKSTVYEKNQDRIAVLV